MYNSFNLPNMNNLPQPPKVYTMEVINSVEELSFKSAPTNGNPAYFMLANENKIFQMRWNGRTNEILAFNVFPCVEFQQNQNGVNQTENKTEKDRIAVLEQSLNTISTQMNNLLKSLGANDESTSNRNTATAG